jgi:hypothetical protein
MKKNQREYSYTVIFEPTEEGGYVVTCPALPGPVTEGDTLEEARRWQKTPSAATWKASERTDYPSRVTGNQKNHTRKK